MNRYGIKCTRLLQLRSKEPFASVIPALYPMDADAANEWLKRNRDADENDLAAHLQRLYPNLIRDVAASCGPPPWIVRSSGEEDLADFANAGAYLSAVCEREDDIHRVVAQVMLSGRTDRARKQGGLFGKRGREAAIPVFVQPLLRPREPIRREVAFRAVPYVGEQDILALREWLQRLHAEFPGEPLDCEWVALTDCGVVSMTSLSELRPNGLAGQIAFGFNLFSAQHVQEANSIRYLLPGDPLNLWQGAAFQEVQVNELHLVQVRPARHYAFLQKVGTLTDRARKQLEGKTAVCLHADEIILPGKVRKAGKYLKAPTLNDAWQKYINDAALREDIAAVFVRIGSRTEHAGLMFGQVGLPVVRLEIEAIPENMDYAVVDLFTMECRFSHSPIELPEDAFTDAEILPLSNDCLVVHDAELPERDPVAHGAHETHLRRRLEIPYLTEKSKEMLLRNSSFPDPRFIMYGIRGAYSPTYYGKTVCRVVAAAGDDAVWSDWPVSARRYMAAVRHAAGVEHRPFLQKWWPDGIGEADGTEVLAYWRALNVEPLLAESVGDAVDRLRNRISQDRLSGRTIDGLQRFEILRLFQDHMDRLPVYEEEEKMRLIASFVGVLAECRQEELAVLADLCRDPYLNTVDLCRVAHYAITDAVFLERYRRHEAERKAVAFPRDMRDATDRFRRFNATFEALLHDIGKYEDLANLKSSLCFAAAELYDQTAKEILYRLTIANDPADYAEYLSVMQIWLEWIGKFDGRLQIAAKFAAWIDAQKARQAEIKNYFLEEVHWQTRLAEAESAREPDELSMSNPHQLHNVLHQWSLSLVPVAREEWLPEFIRRMVRFANTFSEQDNRLMRFQRDFFEIELSMCTHKAAFVFGKWAITIEFSEPPSVEDHEVARVLAYELILDKFTQWFGEYRFQAHVEKVVGTWTCHMTVTPLENRDFEREDFARVFEILRFLLDSSYDFSHTPNRVAEELKTAFLEPEWPEIFGRMVEYRVNFDDSRQFMNVHLFPISSFFTVVCLSGEIRETLIAAYRSGFTEAVRELIRLEERMLCAKSYKEWEANMEKASYVALLMSAVWPEESVAALDELCRHPVALDLLCRSLFKRRDMTDSICAKAFRGGDDISACLKSMVLRYCPDVYFERQTADVKELAVWLSRQPGFKRAKQYLLHAFAHELDEGVLQALMEKLAFVPYGREAEQEERLIRLIGKGQRRYDIRNEVIYFNYHN